MNLKPCPFCGCEARYKDGIIFDTVKCCNVNCGAMVKYKAALYVEKLKVRWNRRVNNKELDLKAEKLIKYTQHYVMCNKLRVTAARGWPPECTCGLDNLIKEYRGE